MSAARFPGHVYDVDALPLTIEAPALSAELVETFGTASVVVAEALDDDGAIDAALVWSLQDGAQFGDIPAAWVSQAVQVLDQGGAVLLLAHDDATERGVRAGLLDAFELGGMPAHRMGRA